MKFYDAFFKSWMVGLAGLIGGIMGAWISKYFENVTLWGATMILLGMIGIVVLMTIFQLTVDHFRPS